MPWRNLIFLFLLSSQTLCAGDRLWVFLKAPPSAQAVTLTARAEQRLSVRGTPSPPGSQAITPELLAQLRATGVEIRHASRFLNAVSVELQDRDQLQRLAEHPAVVSIRPLASHSSRQLDTETDNPSLARVSSLDYGPSDTQNDLLAIPAIHDLGYSGSGILIGVFDAGFDPVHPVFAAMDIVDQYDFVDHEPNPAGVGHEHGINVLSALGGYAPGHLIGPAFAASFLLARTENDIGESPTEEDNWVAALEWADSLGVDIISSSVNYREFDDPLEDYPYSAMDGQTAIITQAANVAAQRGILVVNSVGNEGSSAGSVWPPADSPHVLSVGAISAAGDVLYFSSRGPTYDGRIKPDVVTLGTAVYLASGSSSYKYGQGTSFATPLAAGLAALLLEADPALTPDAVIDLIHNNADAAHHPDNDRGYGIPQLLSFFQQHQLGDQAYIYPNPFDGPHLYIRIPASASQQLVDVRLYDIRGRFLGQPTLIQQGPDDPQIDLSPLYPLSSQIYLLSLSTDTGRYSIKFIHLH